MTTDSIATINTVPTASSARAPRPGRSSRRDGKRQGSVYAQAAMDAMLTARDSARSAREGRFSPPGDQGKKRSAAEANLADGGRGGSVATTRDGNKNFAAGGVNYRPVEPHNESAMTKPHATQGARVDVTVAERLLSLAKVAQRQRVHR